MLGERTAEKGVLGGFPLAGGESSGGVAPSAALSEEALAAGAGEGEDARGAFERSVGEVLLFLCMLPPYEGMYLRDARGRVVAPMALRQYEVRRVGGVLVGYRSWAMASADVAARLRADAGAAGGLTREEWRGGDERVVVDEAGVLDEESLSAAMSEMAS